MLAREILSILYRLLSFVFKIGPLFSLNITAVVKLYCWVVVLYNVLFIIPLSPYYAFLMGETCTVCACMFLLMKRSIDWRMVLGTAGEILRSGWILRGLSNERRSLLGELELGRLDLAETRSLCVTEAGRIDEFC